MEEGSFFLKIKYRNQVEAKKRRNEIEVGIVLPWILDKALIGLDNNMDSPIFFLQYT